MDEARRGIAKGARRALAVLALSSAGAAMPVLGPSRQPSHELYCDVSEIRSWGWTDAKATDEDAWRAVLSYAEWRLAVAGVDVEVEHAPGTEVLELDGKDGESVEAAVRLIAGGLSCCEFFLVAQDADLAGGLEAERGRFDAWKEENPGRPWLEYNSDPGRAERGVAWFPTRFAGKQGPPMAVRMPRTASGGFSGVDFERVYASKDALGYPAVGFELRAERIEAFAAFTEENLGRRLAIVLRGEVRSAPTLNAKLMGGGIIEGRFTEAEVADLVTVLRQGQGLEERLGPPLLFLIGQMAKLTASVALAAALAGLCVWLIRRRRRRAGADDADNDPGWPR